MEIGGSAPFDVAVWAGAVLRPDGALVPRVVVFVGATGAADADAMADDDADADGSGGAGGGADAGTGAEAIDDAEAAAFVSELLRCMRPVPTTKMETAITTRPVNNAIAMATPRVRA